MVIKKAWLYGGAAACTILLGAVNLAHGDDVAAGLRVADGGISQPLTAEPGDPARGRRLAFDRTKGNCLVCHSLPGAEAASPGDLGPDLAGVGARRTVPELRLRMVDPRRIDPEARMPAFYKTEGLTQVARAFAGKPLLQAQEIEDIVAYLASLQ
jgi:sulfur-oxidizing protein SoxX